MSGQRTLFAARREGERVEYNKSLAGDVKLCVMRAVDLFPEGDFAEISFEDREVTVMDNQANRIGGTMLPPDWNLQEVDGKWTFVKKGD